MTFFLWKHEEKPKIIIMDDNFKVIYKILTAFEKSLDVEDFDINTISAKALGISEIRLVKYLEMLIDADYITGLDIVK